MDQCQPVTMSDGITVRVPSSRVWARSGRWEAKWRRMLAESDRCGSGVTHRDEDHRESVCALPAGHRSPHDDGEGASWTDAEHWQEGDQ